MNEELPFAPATERNQAPILAVLRRVFAAPARVLEIGSGTGQHAVHFAQNLPQLTWVASETQANQTRLAPRLSATSLPNIEGPLLLDVDDGHWPVSSVQGVFAANVTHIMGWSQVVAMFAGVGRVLEFDGAFCLYGPFNYNGEFTSASNAQFDAHLRARAAHMGLRDFADLGPLATAAGLTLEKDNPMPANNRLLVWRKADVGCDETSRAA